MTTIVFDGQFLAADGQQTGPVPSRGHSQLRENKPGTHFVPGDDRGHDKVLRDVKKIALVSPRHKPLLDGKPVVAISGAGSSSKIAAINAYVTMGDGELMDGLVKTLKFSDVVNCKTMNNSTLLVITRDEKTSVLEARVLEWEGFKLIDTTKEFTMNGVVAIGSGCRAAGLYRMLNPEATAMDCVAAAALVDKGTGIALYHVDLLSPNKSEIKREQLPDLKTLKKPLYKGYVKRTRAIVVPKITLPTFDKE